MILIRAFAAALIAAMLAVTVTTAGASADRNADHGPGPAASEYGAVYSGERRSWCRTADEAPANFGTCMSAADPTGGAAETTDDDGEPADEPTTGGDASDDPAGDDPAGDDAGNGEEDDEGESPAPTLYNTDPATGDRQRFCRGISDEDLAADDQFAPKTEDGSNSLAARFARCVNGRLSQLAAPDPSASCASAPHRGIAPAPPKMVPGSPAGFNDGTQGWITLEWEHPGDPSITHYRYRLIPQPPESHPAAPWVVLPGSNADTTSAVIDGLLISTSHDNNSYVVRLEAVNGAGAGHLRVPGRTRTGLTLDVSGPPPVAAADSDPC